MDSVVLAYQRTLLAQHLHSPFLPSIKDTMTRFSLEVDRLSRWTNKLSELYNDYRQFTRRIVSILKVGMKSIGSPMYIRRNRACCFRFNRTLNNGIRCNTRKTFHSVQQCRLIMQTDKIWSWAKLVTTAAKVQWCKCRSLVALGAAGMEMSEGLVQTSYS